MKKLEFSLPKTFNKGLEITGKPTDSWNQKKSGEELYNILRVELPSGTYRNLQKRMMVELLLQSYPEINDLKRFKEEFDKLRRSYILPSFLSASFFYESLEEAIARKETQCQD
jgi:hypothetical protein